MVRYLPPELRNIILHKSIPRSLVGTDDRELPGIVGQQNLILLEKLPTLFQRSFNRMIARVFESSPLNDSLVIFQVDPKLLDILGKISDLRRRPSVSIAEGIINVFHFAQSRDQLCYRKARYRH